jgi:anthranilate synthase component 1
MERCKVDPLELPRDAGQALLALHRNQPHRYPVLLESAATSSTRGRYSLLLAEPGERLTLDAQGRLEGPHARGGFLASLERWWVAEARPLQAAPWPFAGGWFLLLGYELAGEVEPTLRLPPAPPGAVSLAWRMRAAVVHDHLEGTTAAIAEPEVKGFLESLRSDLAGAGARQSALSPRAKVEEEDPGRFRRAVARVLEHIAAGDIYQANLSRRWRAQLSPGTTPADVYARLRRTNPGPFAGIADLGDSAIVSSSPERLVSVRGRLVETRPIAGTRPRRDASDERAIDDLIGNPKERAEHIMLIDLERNDLGRLCEPGTVEVDEMMRVESYEHVHHIVSNVRGLLRREVTPVDVLRALFPGGTITGCPKVRCMQLIGELEGEGRGAYTGSMGYLGLDGSLDLNILIRTLAVCDGVAELRAGAGIVADSDVERELEETRAKAQGVLCALGGPS